MKVFDDFVKRYAQNRHICEEEARKHKLVEYVRAYYEEKEEEETNERREQAGSRSD